jgi:CO/xanthine dehydrogenase Mo-binding subunit
MDASGGVELKSVGKRPIRSDGWDKVTGRAAFGADLTAPGMLVGKILRSPHAHARIKSIDTSKAKALAGVKSVVTAADMPAVPWKDEIMGYVPANYGHLSENTLARDTALYDGHAVAAVAATSERIARRALALIEVEYEILPHVLDVAQAMEPDAPVLHDRLFTGGLDKKPRKPSNIAQRVEYSIGDVEAGFAKADVIVEKTFRTKPVHQGYIEPQAVLASPSHDGQVQIWCSTQSQFVVRTVCARVLGMKTSEIRVYPTEVGGAFGGKIIPLIEPVAALLARKAGRPVKIVAERDEVFRAMGNAPGSQVWVKIGATRDGTVVAADAVVKLQAGAFPGAPIQSGAGRAFGFYYFENARSVGYDVVVNQPKTSAYRAPGAPCTLFAVESVMDDVAKKIGMDPIDFRIVNEAREGKNTIMGPTFGIIGCDEVLRKAKAHPHYSAPLKKHQGRGVACGFWFNSGGESSANLTINEDGTAALVSGSPDLSGTRVTLAQMAAEELGIDVSLVNPSVGDTGSVGYTFLTGGSRVTFATGIAVVEAARDVIRQACERAAKIWDIPADAVKWEDGHAMPASPNAGEFPPMSLAEIASTTTKTGGPIATSKSVNAPHLVGPAFGTHICDVEVDRDTGQVTILRYTVVQDVGRAIHPSYVEGQLQGGAAQGIGWALNEEMFHGADGRLLNAGYLDYRIPLTSDLPMIDTVLVEVPNIHHPYGVRGVGETAICPPAAAVALAVSNAIGIRMTELPLSPTRILAALKAKEANGKG